MKLNETSNGDGRDTTKYQKIINIGIDSYDIKQTLVIQGYLRDLPYTIPIDIIHTISIFYVTV